MNSLQRSGVGGLALALILIGGCVPPAAEEFTPISSRTVPPYTPKATAGLPVAISTDPKALDALVARSARFGRRSDPFLLLPNEVQFERSQTAERLFANQGAFNLEYQPPVAPNPGQGGAVVEPQPYRRLSGIVIGDAVVGILETQGQDAILIRPGQYIPGTEWRVVLINEDRAVLRRAGNRLPKEVSVNLELPPPGFSNGTTGNGAGTATGGGRGPGAGSAPAGGPSGSAG
ncbi:hypothetical protein EON79_22250 [bacterium]|nr:MAG: hypothetical protein EON79_22250 [bacterium]